MTVTGAPLRCVVSPTRGGDNDDVMDRPSGGWTDLVTNQVLAARLDSLGSGLRSEMADLRVEMADLRVTMAQEFRAQTWRLIGTTFVAFGLFATLVRLT